MLFVCMIVIAAMVGFNKSATETQPRALMQVYSEEGTNSLKQDAVTVK